jgi:hypothetical protein
VTTPDADAVCPRCGRRFHCGARDAAPCACTAVRLYAATLAALRERWSDCLCRECLVALAAGEALEQPTT